MSDLWRTDVQYESNDAIYILLFKHHFKESISIDNKHPFLNLPKCIFMDYNERVFVFDLIYFVK